MKVFTTTAFALSLSICAFSQAKRVPLDKAFIEKTIEYYYNTQSRLHKGSSKFFIEKDSLTLNAKTDYSNFKVEFLTPDEAPAKLPQIQGSAVKLDRLMIRWITYDTIDVVITGCTIGERKINQVVNGKPVVITEKFLTNCTDNFVDTPTCRFVFDRTLMTWAQINRGKVVK